MKDWFKIITVSLIVGLAGATLTCFLFVKHSVNWTAVACFVSVIALIFTTYENRRRFYLDYRQKVNINKSEELATLTGEFLTAYEKSQLISILIKEDELLVDWEKSHFNEDDRNSIVFNIRSVINKMKLLENRISSFPESKNFYSLIYSTLKYMDDFNKNVEHSDLDSEMEYANMKSSMDDITESATILSDQILNSLE